MNDKDKILIIEDEDSILMALSDDLKIEGYEVLTAKDGLSGLSKAKEQRYDLIILDIMLPQMNGLEVCKQLRQAGITTPILMLTAKSQEIDKVLGLELGADDYMTKPFSIKELIARVRALLRRIERSNSNVEEIIKHHQMEVNFTKRVVYLNGSELDLTVKEFELLSLFLHNPGRTFSRSELLNRIWGYQFEGYEHTVNTHINRLRKKIEKSVEKPEYLLTVWGVGYKFSEDLH